MFSPPHLALIHCRYLWKVKVLAAQSCPILCDTMYYSPPFSSVHVIPQARILEWVVIPFSMGSSWPRDWILISCIASRFFIICATREALKDSSIAGTDLPTINDHLNLFLIRIKSLATASLNFNTPWKKFKVEIRNESLRPLQNTGRIGLRVDNFRKRFYEPNFLHLKSRKAIESLRGTSVPHDYQQPS